MTTFISFARRKNRDSTDDSICTRCYQTIASGRTDASFSSEEANHHCDAEAELDRRHEISLHQHHIFGANL